MLLHSVSFSLYNLSIVVFYFFFYFYETFPQSNLAADNVLKYTLIAWTVTTFTNFIASMFLLWIFLKFLPKTEKEEIMNKTTELDETRCSMLRNYEDDVEPANQ